MITVEGPLGFVAGELRERLLEDAVPFARGELQAQDVSGMDLLVTHELMHVVTESPVPPSPEWLEHHIKPTMPWAELQFLERVGGEGVNPGETYKDWPWYRAKQGEGVEEHKPEGKFSHTYMERYWPKWSGVGPPPQFVAPNHGIRFPYGDLDNLVNLLATRMLTRQAYLPVWFPEDLYAADVERERVPCSLGYVFMMSDSKHLDISYSIRSCDYVRHYRNDVYMTCRLLQWVITQLQDTADLYLQPGVLHMNITNLHCFEGDLPALRKETL
jgi:hypothetical protein